MKLLKLAAIGAAAALSLPATGAHAQATRTWVSGVGNDADPCSRTAPCKTFSGAFTKTAAGGEINCLDPGGFGAVTITKSLSISCPYTEGGALASGNGITLNMPATTDVAFLRGLDIFGVSPPSNGIRFVNNGSLHVEDSVIRRFNASGSFGISIQPSGAAKIYLTNVTVANNGSGATGGGILVQPTGAAGSAKVYMNDVRSHNNANNALSLNTTGNTSAAGVTAVINNSSFVGSTFGILVTTAVGTGPAVAMVTNTDVFDNSGVGIRADGGSARARVRLSTITGNSTGVSTLNGGAVASFGNNNLEFNSTDGTFTPPTILEE
jgi:hypothetical protein